VHLHEVFAQVGTPLADQPAAAIAVQVLLCYLDGWLFFHPILLPLHNTYPSTIAQEKEELPRTDTGSREKLRLSQASHLCRLPLSMEGLVIAQKSVCFNALL
jgi:hypothetical protein